MARDFLHRRIVIEGNDGSGKTTMVRLLTNVGFTNVQDRGEMTKATEHPLRWAPVEGTLYILLDCSPRISRQRLVNREGDQVDADPYHSLESLRDYRKRFLSLVKKFDAKILDTNWRISPVQRIGCRVLPLVVPAGQRITLGHPSGRLALGIGELWDLPTDDLWQNAPDRLMVWDKYAPMRFIRTRTKTYPQMVALGDLDVAVVGEDALQGSPWEHGCEVIHREPQANGCRIVIAAETSELPAVPLLRVATPFSEWASHVFGERKIPHTIYSVSGGSEGLIRAGLADVIFDVVETGNTLQANGLQIVESLGPVHVCLIRRKRS